MIILQFTDGKVVFSHVDVFPCSYNEEFPLGVSKKSGISNTEPKFWNFGIWNSVFGIWYLVRFYVYKKFGIRFGIWFLEKKIRYSKYTKLLMGWAQILLGLLAHLHLVF